MYDYLIYTSWFIKNLPLSLFSYTYRFENLKLEGDQMKVFSISVFYMMNTLKIIGMICLAIVMLIISAGVISRLLGSPLLGVIELAEIFHFLVIIFSFGYTQTKKEHIAIGLLVDRYSPKVQLIFDNIAHVLTVSVCIVITYIFFLNSMKETKTTLLLDFPFMVLKIIVTIGFFVWGLVALSQISFKTPLSEKEVSSDV